MHHDRQLKFHYFARQSNHKKYIFSCSTDVEWKFNCVLQLDTFKVSRKADGCLIKYHKMQSEKTFLSTFRAEKNGKMQ